MKRNKLSAILKKRMMEIYKNVPKLSTIERIAKALGVSPICVYFPFFYHRVHSNQRFASFTEERRFSYNNLCVTPSNFSCRPPWFSILKYTHMEVSPLIFFQDKNNTAEQLPLEQEIELQNKKRAILQFLEKEIDNILHNR